MAGSPGKPCHARAGPIRFCRSAGAHERAAGRGERISFLTGWSSSVQRMASTLDRSVTADEKLVLERLEQLLREHSPTAADAKTFLGAQFDLGLAWVTFPEGEGGLGVNPGPQKLGNQRPAQAGPPRPDSRHPLRPRT